MAFVLVSDQRVEFNYILLNPNPFEIEHWEQLLQLNRQRIASVDRQYWVEQSLIDKVQAGYDEWVRRYLIITAAIMQESPLRETLFYI